MTCGFALGAPIDAPDGFAHTDAQLAPESRRAPDESRLAARRMKGQLSSQRSKSAR